MKKFTHIFTYIFISLFLNAFDVFDKVDDQPVQNSPKDVFENLEDQDIIYENEAKLIIMNKITGVSKEFIVNVGSNIEYGRAEVEVHKCGKIKNSNEHFILVSLNESVGENGKKQIFRGWIFSKSLSLSAVEHPIYQLIAVSCI